MVSSALIDAKLTSGSVGPAPVSILRFSAFRTRKAPNLMLSSSALKRKDEKELPEKTKVALRPILSASGPSVIRPLIGLLGRNSALSAVRTRPVLPSWPPLNWTPPVLGNVTRKLLTPRPRLWKVKIPGMPASPGSVMVPTPSRNPLSKTVSPGVGVVQVGAPQGRRVPLTPFNAGSSMLALWITTSFCGPPFGLFSA